VHAIKRLGAFGTDWQAGDVVDYGPQQGVTGEHEDGHQRGLGKLADADVVVGAGRTPASLGALRSRTGMSFTRRTPAQAPERR
jgi:hypothetical protein